MATTETTMKLTDPKPHLSQVINRAARGETRVIVEKSGLPVAAIVSAHGYRQIKEREAAEATRRAQLHKLLTRLSGALRMSPTRSLSARSSAQ